MSENQTTHAVTGYMCKIDFDVEQFEPVDGNTVYSCIEDLIRNHPCSDTCGIVEVEVRLKRVVKETSDDY